MGNSELAAQYAGKDSEYFDYPRFDMLPFVPANARRILDVGCGAGPFGANLKQSRQLEVWGVELNEEASRKAAARLDHVINSPFGPDLALPARYFDAICFLDVLEHVPDPGAMLRHAVHYLAPGGRIVASIPNFRHFDNMWNLVIKKEARYEPHGVMDRTHLRIFTKSSIRLLFDEANLTIERLEGIGAKTGSHKFTLCNILTLGLMSDMRFLQFAVVARRDEDRSSDLITADRKP